MSSRTRQRIRSVPDRKVVDPARGVPEFRQSPPVDPNQVFSSEGDRAGQFGHNFARIAPLYQPSPTSTSISHGPIQEVMTQTITATIRRAEHPAGATEKGAAAKGQSGDGKASGTGVLRDLDNEGEEEDIEVEVEEEGAEVEVEEEGAMEEPNSTEEETEESTPVEGETEEAESAEEEGIPVDLPDIVAAETEMLDDADPIAGNFTYNGSVTQSGAVNPFGATMWSTFTLSNIKVTPTAGTFVVQLTLENPITFNVASGGKKNVADENDAVLKAGNYQQAVSDLTPNMSDLGGRPPRTQFWAEDLTIKHEKFHADERKQFAGAGLTAAQAWLNGQAAGSIGDVQTLLQAIPNRVIASSQAAMPYPAKEERAYGDGAPLYRARAQTIKQKGDAGKYPA